VPKRQLRDVPLENGEIPRLEPLIADYRRIINECGIRRCVCRRHRHSRIRCDPKWRRALCVYCHPVRRQCGWRDPVEIFALYRLLPTGRTLRRTRSGDGGKDIDSAPASNIVWRARRSALLVGDKLGRFVQYCPTCRNTVTQIGSPAPQQCHGASDMRSRHGCAAKTHISVIGSVVAGASTSARRRNVRLYPVTPIDYHWAAAAKGSNDVLACS
jgi:hypothetical protein